MRIHIVGMHSHLRFDTAEQTDSCTCSSIKYGQCTEKKNYNNYVWKVSHQYTINCFTNISSGNSSVGTVSNWKLNQVQYCHRFEIPVWQRNFLPESTPASSADSLMVSEQPLCAITCINICAHVKNHKHWQPYHCLDAWKYCTHWCSGRNG